MEWFFDLKNQLWMGSKNHQASYNSISPHFLTTTRLRSAPESKGDHGLTPFRSGLRQCVFVLLETEQLSFESTRNDNQLTPRHIIKAAPCNDPGGFAEIKYLSDVTIQWCLIKHHHFDNSPAIVITLFVYQVVLSRKLERDLSVFESSCHLSNCVPHMMEASDCPLNY